MRNRGRSAAAKHATKPGDIFDFLSRGLSAPSVAILLRLQLPCFDAGRSGCLSFPPPGNRSCEFGYQADICEDTHLVLRYCMVLVMALWCMYVLAFVLCEEERAKSRTHTFWGTSLLICLIVDTSALRGRTLEEGTFVPSASKSPRLFPRKKVLQPMGPSTSRFTNPWRR